MQIEREKFHRGQSGHIILLVTSEGCSNFIVHTKKGQRGFSTCDLRATIDLFVFLPSLLK